MICLDRLVSGLLGAAIALILIGMVFTPVVITALAAILQIIRDSFRKVKEICDD